MLPGQTATNGSQQFTIHARGRRWNLKASQEPPTYSSRPGICLSQYLVIRLTSSTKSLAVTINADLVKSFSTGKQTRSLLISTAHIK